MQEHKITINENNFGKRIDKIIVDFLPNLTRSFIKKLFDECFVFKDGKNDIKPSQKTKMGEEYLVIIPEAKNADPVPDSTIPLNVVFEDEHIIIINKQAGLVVHPAAGNWDGTLVNALIHHCGDSLSGIGGVKRPGIVHRLDKDTSGLMVVAKNDHAHNHLCGQFHERSLSRIYHALVWGRIMPPSGIIKTNIHRSIHNRQKMDICDENTGRVAITHYRTIDTYVKNDLITSVSLIECKLQTGRTHQIRVHMNHLNHSIVGDQLYGNIPKGIRKTWDSDSFFIKRDFQALQAIKLSLIHPNTNELMTFEIESDFLREKVVI